MMTIVTIDVTAIEDALTGETIRWHAFCTGCRAGRSFSSQADLRIWKTAHEDSCTGEG